MTPANGLYSHHERVHVSNFQEDELCRGVDAVHALLRERLS